MASQEIGLVVSGSEKSTSVRSDSSHKIVRNAIQDLFEVQRSTLDHVRSTVEKQKYNYVLKRDFEETSNALEHERLDHMKTKLLLENEREKLEFVTSENKILKAQMHKESETHEEVARSLQSKATRETKRCDFLLEKISEAERKLEELHDTLQLKDNEIASLKQRLKVQKNHHKHTLEEIDINKMQEEYMIKTLSDSQRRKKETGKK